MSGSFLDDGRVTVWLAVGLAAGLYFFFKGFFVYREYRVVEDTPEIPIRSVAMGLVHIHGEARPGDGGMVCSPVGRTECLAYKVDIERWVGNMERGRWHHWKTDWGGPLFALADATGRVTINARGADLLVGQNTRAVADARMAFASPADPLDSPGAGAHALPTDAELMEYAESVPGGSLDDATGKYRLTEYVIFGGWPYDVVGTYADNPQAAGELDRKLIRKGENERTYVISSESQAETQADLRYRAWLQVFGGAGLAIVCLAGLLSQFGLLK
jgi:hypothetical protein